MKMKYLLLISIILWVTACKKNEKTEQPVFKIETPDTTKTHEPDIFYLDKKNISQELSLEPLENGVDSFELRFWAKVEVINVGHIFNIKKNKERWTCLHYIYFTNRKFVEGVDFFEEYVDSFSVKKIQPATNWETFFKKIERENIYELPAQADIPGWKNTVCDGYTFYVEFATKSRYKFYWFNCPDVYEDKFDECLKMANIVKIFHDEFGLNMGYFGIDKYRCSNGKNKLKDKK